MSLHILRSTKSEEVGNSKWMTTSATLSRDGTLIIDVYTNNQNPFKGLRGRVLVIAYDSEGNALGMSKVLRCKTRGGGLDFFTSSAGRETFVEKMGAQAGQRAVALDIWQEDAESPGGQIQKAINLMRITTAVISAVH